MRRSARALASRVSASETTVSTAGVVAAAVAVVGPSTRVRSPVRSEVLDSSAVSPGRTLVAVGGGGAASERISVWRPEIEPAFLPRLLKTPFTLSRTRRLLERALVVWLMLVAFLSDF